MKTKFLWIAAASLPLLGRCTNANSESQPTNALSPAPSVVAVTNVPAPTNALPTAAVPVAKPVNTDLTPPENVKLSASAGEIVRLAQSGVDSGVMLAYVTNSVHTFGLASEEIVYLNDLGVPSAVMTAMIQHDQRIREASLAGATVTSPATPAPNQSVWSAGTVADPSNTWQQPVAEAAPASQAEGVALAPPPPAEELPQQVTVNYFYDTLSPYGTWVDIEGYGRCWRPTVVAANPGWRPYVHGGRWVWTDSGWYWYSDYSWGWAPFHYGRWFSHPGWGWCWMPGGVWGPAWVSWSYTDSYCGWAPLPPAACYSPGFGFTYYGGSCGSSFSFGLSWGCFTYVGYNHFYGHHYEQTCVPRHEVRGVHGHSTIVNNYIHGDNNTIINQGIGTERITAATRSEIHRTTVREVAGGPRGPRTVRNETLASDGRTLSVTRNAVPGTQSVAPGSSPRSSAGQLIPNNTASGSSAAAPTPRAVTVHAAGQSPRSVGVAPGSPGAPAPSAATPAPNSRSETPRGPRTERVSTAAPSVAAASTAPTPPAQTTARTVREENPRGSSVVIIGSRNHRQPESATPAAAPPRPANNGATPWLNSSLQATAAASPTRQTAPNSIAPATPFVSVAPAPAPIQPPVRQNSPRIEHSSPPRTYGAPAPPQAPQPYSPPVPRLSAPAYAPPARTVEPRVAAPPQMSAPRPPAPAPSAPPSSSPGQAQPSSGGNNSRKDR